MTDRPSELQIELDAIDEVHKTAMGGDVPCLDHIRKERWRRPADVRGC